MAILETVTPQQATDKVAAVYGQIQQAFGHVPNAIQLFSVNPDFLEVQWRMLGYYGQHPTLSFPLLATIRMLVSIDTECAYCVGNNEGMLINRAGFTPEQVMAAKADPAQAPLSAKDKAMLLFVLKATRHSNSVEAADLDELRLLGWTDRDIFDALNHGAQQGAIDILFNAFKVDKDM